MIDCTKGYWRYVVSIVVADAKAEIQTNFSSYSGLSTAHQKGTTRLYSSRRVEHHPLFSLFSRSKKVGILSSSASSREPYFAHWSESRIFLKNGNLWHSGTWILAKKVELGWGANFFQQLWNSQSQLQMTIQHHKAMTQFSRSPNIRQDVVSNQT